MSTIFSKIVAGEIPCHKVAETENCLAFLDINPVRLGHTLCIPKIEVDYIFNLEDDALTELTLFSKKVARAIEKEFPCNRVGTNKRNTVMIRATLQKLGSLSTLPLTLQTKGTL